MPRNNRIHYTQAMYHVMHQGNYKQALFFESEDYQHAYVLFDRAVASYGCKIHLFCLMTNHIHLLIQVNDVPLSKIMQSFSTAYANYINKKMQRRGHLFRGRYRSKLVQDDGYLLELCYYIHNNPLKAKMVANLDSYLWSSHLCYRKFQHLNWLTTDMMNKKLMQCIDAEDPYNKFLQQWKKGSVDPVYCKFDDEGNLTIFDNASCEVNAIRSLDLSGYPLAFIIHFICESLSVSLANVQSDAKREMLVLARMLITYFAHYHAGYTFVKIAAILHCCANSLSKTLRCHFSDEVKRKKLQAKIALIRHEFLSLKRI